MTNNHCPEFPARAFNSRANEMAIRDFAESILEKIVDFAETFSMDDAIRIHSDIIDTWMDCKRCEIKVCDVQEHQSAKISKEILAFLLEANL